MKNAFLLLITCFSFSCALTAPDGKMELMDDIKRDHKQMQELKEKSFDGAPRYVKVRQYHVFSNGNIYGKRWILYQVDRRKVDIDSLLEKLKE